MGDQLPTGRFLAGSSSVQLAAPVVDPRLGLLIPPACAIYKKKPVLAYALFFKDGGEGGIDSLRSPCGQISRGLVICPTGCASCRPPVGASHPPCVCDIQKRARTWYALFFKDGGEGGIDSLRSPCGQIPRGLVICPTGCASCRPPVGASHPPPECAIYKKKPVPGTRSSLKMAVRGGLTRCARPAGRFLGGSSSVQLAAPVVDPRSGLLIPP